MPFKFPSPKLTSTIDNAYLAAEQLGENAGLCEANSTFLTSYKACQSCVVANSDNIQVIQTYLEPEFAPFLDFCSAQTPQSAGPSLTSTVTGVPIAVTSSIDLAQSSSLSSLLSQAKLSLLAEASSLGLDLGTTEQVTATVFYTPTGTPSQNSTSTCKISPLPKVQLLIITVALAATSSPPITKSTSTNHAWIAGAVIGPLFLVALGILAFWLWKRTKRRNMVAGNNQQFDEEKKEDMIKAQLHADSLQIQRHELEGHATTELGNERVPELPALEPVGSELSSKKQAFIRRKPVGGVT